MNGYAPAVPEDYYENVFSKLSSLNQGVLDENQRQLLLSIGVNLLVFHEQPYPPKVSPFPSSVALRRLRGNPALRQIAAADGVFVFALAGEKAQPRMGPEESQWEVNFPAAFHWPMSRLSGRARDPAKPCVFRTHVRAPVPLAPRMHYKLLLSGGGRLQGDRGHEVAVPDQPTWVSVPFTDPMGEAFVVADGEPVMHHALITAGTDVSLSSNQTFSWAASDLFHLGYSDGNAVTFEQGRNGSGIVLYGPDLPFPAGQYKATLVGNFAEGDAFVASTIGDGGQRLAIATLPEDDGNGPSTATITFRHDGLLPLRLEYHFAGRGESRVARIGLTSER